jgi:hypothetical protein
METLEAEEVDLGLSELEILKSFIGKPVEEFLKQVDKLDYILLVDGAHPMDDLVPIPAKILSHHVTFMPSNRKYTFGF